MKNSETLIGNERVKKELAYLLKKQALSKPLLFCGIDGLGKKLFAKRFAASILKKTAAHPDLHKYQVEGKTGMHSIRAMRAMLQEFYLQSYEGGWKVFIIEDAERMLPTSANALLKSLEEPPKDTCILLISSQPEQLLPTIVSRCRKIQFAPIEETLILKHLKEKGFENVEARAARAQGSLSEALKEPDPLQERFLELLFCPKAYHLMLEDLQEIEEQMEKERKKIESCLKKELTAETAIEKAAFEKEIEGASFLHFFNKSSKLFEQALLFYRDQILLSVGAKAKFLSFERSKELFLNKPPKIPSLEKVQDKIDHALLCLQRSMKLSVCLEHFLLDLQTRV